MFDLQKSPYIPIKCGAYSLKHQHIDEFHNTQYTTESCDFFE